MRRASGRFVSLPSQDSSTDGPSTSGKDRLGAGRKRISRERGLSAKARVAGLDTRVDDRDTLVVSDERALHRVDRKTLHIREAEGGDARQALEFVGERHIRHEAVIRVHGHAKALRDEVAYRMLGERRYSAGIHVRRGTELERDPLVADVGGKTAKLHHLAFAYRHVLDKPHPVADAMRAAVLQRLPDRGRPERFARVDGD